MCGIYFRNTYKNKFISVDYPKRKHWVLNRESPNNLLVLYEHQKSLEGKQEMEHNIIVMTKYNALL